MTTYEKHAAEIASRIQVLEERIVRFANHPTLHTRVPGVRAEKAALEAQLPKAVATAKWAKELYA